MMDVMILILRFLIGLVFTFLSGVGVFLAFSEMLPSSKEYIQEGDTSGGWLVRALAAIMVLGSAILLVCGIGLIWGVFQ